jgi:hypothetical protein
VTTKTFYFANAYATGSSGFSLLQDGGSQPSDTQLFAWTPSTITANEYQGYEYTQGPIGNQGTGVLPSTHPVLNYNSSGFADAAVTSTPYTLNFDAGTWSIPFQITGDSSPGTINVEASIRVWRSTTIDGSSGFTEITSGAVLGSATGSLGSGGAATSTVSWSAPAFSLNNEYLFIQVAFKETANSNTGNTMLLRTSHSTSITSTAWHSTIATPAEANDTLSAAATNKSHASLSVTEAADTTVAMELPPWVYIPEDGHGVIVNFEVSYTPPDGHSVVVMFDIPSGLEYTEKGDTLNGYIHNGMEGSVAEAADTLSAAATGVVNRNAALSVTEANDTLSSGATNKTHANLSVTEAADTLSAAATNKTHANLSVTEAADTLSAAATNLTHASATPTEANDTLSSAATNASHASANISEAPDTLTAVYHDYLVSGVSEAVDVLSATATNASHASLSITEAPDTLVAVYHDYLVGLISEALDTLSADGAHFIGVNTTEANDVLSATATNKTHANASVNELGDSLSCSVAVKIAAASNTAEHVDALNASGQLKIAAVSSVLEAPDTFSAAAKARDSGTSPVVEHGDSLSATAKVRIDAYSSIAEVGDLLVGLAKVRVDAYLNVGEQGDRLTGKFYPLIPFLEIPVYTSSEKTHVYATTAPVT